MKNSIPVISWPSCSPRDEHQQQMPPCVSDSTLCRSIMETGVWPQCRQVTPLILVQQPQPWKYSSAMTQRFLLLLGNAFPKNWHLSSDSLLCSTREQSKAWGHIPCLTCCSPPQCLPGPGCAHQCIHCLCCPHCRSYGQRERGTWLHLARVEQWREAVWALSAHTWHKLKERVETNPDLSPCAFCSHAPFSCPINHSSHHLTFC